MNTAALLGALRTALYPLSWVASRVWLHTVAAKRARGAYLHAPMPVISIGNISMGGTGKTPLTQWLVARLIEQGHVPAIVSRGYGRKATHTVALPGSSAATLTPEELGDEPLMHAQRFPTAVIAVSAERLEGCRRAYELGATVAVLDDGFQHLRLHRDLDVVIVDKATLNGRIAPLGTLREPLHTLRHAHLAVAVGNATPQEIHAIAPAIPVVRVSFASEAPQPVVGTNLHLRRTIAASGIANAERFVASLRHHGIHPLDHLDEADHVRWTPAKIERLLNAAHRRGALTVMTTSKDWVKMKQFAHLFQQHNISVGVLPLRCIFASEQEEQLLLHHIAEALSYQHPSRGHRP